MHRLSHTHETYELQRCMKAAENEASSPCQKMQRPQPGLGKLLVSCYAGFGLTAASISRVSTMRNRTSFCLIALYMCCVLCWMSGSVQAQNKRDRREIAKALSETGAVEGPSGALS